MGKLKTVSIANGLRRVADPHRIHDYTVIQAEARYVVERVYTDDGDATDDFMVYDTQRKSVRYQGPLLKAKQVRDYLNGDRKTDKHI